MFPDFYEFHSIDIYLFPVVPSSPRFRLSLVRHLRKKGHLFGHGIGDNAFESYFRGLSEFRIRSIP